MTTFILIALGACVALGIGWAVVGRQMAEERRRRRWKPPTEAEMDAAGQWVQDYIHALGRDHEERHERLLQERRDEVTSERDGCES